MSFNNEMCNINSWHYDNDGKHPIDLQSYYKHVVMFSMLELRVNAVVELSFWRLLNLNYWRLWFSLDRNMVTIDSDHHL